MKNGKFFVQATFLILLILPLCLFQVSLVFAESEGTAQVGVGHSFDLTVVYQNGTVFQGVNVTLSGVGSWITDSNGEIPTQTLIQGNLYNLTITADGYETYTINFTLNEKTDWEIALTPTTADGVEQFDSTYYLLGFTTFMSMLLLIGYIYRRRKNDNHDTS